MQIVPPDVASSAEFLIVGPYVIDTQTQGAASRPEGTGGHSTRAFSGRLLSTERWEANEWTFQSAPILESEFQLLVTLIRVNGGFVNCTGRALAGTLVRCKVKISEAPFVDDGNLGHLRSPTLVLTEQSPLTYT